jgi:hypothetical protein
MIIVLRADTPPRLTDADRLDRLHAECDSDLGTIQFDEFVRPADDDHVWVDVDWLRTSGMAQVGAPEFPADFDAMIAYATKQGWLDDAGTSVRAHIVTA